MALGFDYRLAVLTHGRMATLDRALSSFYASVSPAPSQVLVYADGVRPSLRRGWASRARRDREELRAGPVQQGFCAATGRLWEWASEEGPDYVFWLEHDFVFGRPVDLRLLALVLDGDHRLAQLALVRGPANPGEDAAGGLVEARRADFWRQESVAGPWLRHRSFFTTNPSLMRRRFMGANPWPTDGGGRCEGLFGIDLVRRGYDFGYWGEGERWVDHVGVRTGFGY